MSYYIGFMMLFCFLAIFSSYFFMRETFIKSSNLQGSQYKDSLKNGFLIIAVAYFFRAAYSLSFKYYNSYADGFWGITLQTIVNLLMDLPVIIVVLVINRRTIRLRIILEKDEKKKQDEMIEREIKAARCDTNHTHKTENDD